ncbi:aldolase/citrate lyase family protein [Bradyrhizobium sp. sGM-13]|uniref:HpcH/HpaI aldolase family protein n=1 Tax=Bradyrhizobium sp. sGM-13 TaxID=2831781 RepID=UPI001BD0CD53|nr:aldolase/citrate lyase family protein [Bradyrhizobium sp. sGM-13]
MRPNPLKPRLAAGGCAFGTMTFEFFTPGYPTICREAGAEFILYDMEHSGVGFETMKAQFAFCRGLDLVPLVRVPSDHYHYIARALDIGAMGIMVPMVETPEQAKAVVVCTRYPPAGRRGAAFNVAAHDDYSSGRETDKIAQANARTMVIALVETAKGIANVDAIAAVDGVDVVWLGHYDLTNFIGIPGEFDNPKFHAAVDGLVEACKKHGKTPGFLAGNEQWARNFRARGFRMIAYGVDTLLMQNALAHGIKLLQGTVTN